MPWWPLFAAVGSRLGLAAFGVSSALSSRVEIVTPVTSLRRLAEGRWLMRLGLSPYAGSMFHGSPLLLKLLGPLTDNAASAEATDPLGACLRVLPFVVADLLSAHLLAAIASRLRQANQNATPGKGEHNRKWDPTANSAAELASLVYLLNPWTIATCIGGSTSAIENAVILLGLYGGIAGNAPLAAFGWALSSHLSMYPLILIVPIALLLKNGPDGPPPKNRHLAQSHSPTPPSSQGTGNEPPAPTSTLSSDEPEPAHMGVTHVTRDWSTLGPFLGWAVLWWTCILALCILSLRARASLPQMFKETYGFILAVDDLTPNLGIFWYFFTEMFEFFRPFFLFVFHANVIVLVAPLTIRLSHRPFFLATVLLTLSSILKSYPSAADAAFYLSLYSLFVEELMGMKTWLVIFCGYLYTALLGPIMYNLWIWKGIANANFYFAVALVYTTIQALLVVESVLTMLRADRNRRGLSKLVSHTN